MHFCELCGKILEIKAESDKIIAYCSCGFIKEVESGQISSEKIIKKDNIGEDIVVESNKIEKGFPHICKKCGYDECDVLDVGAPYSDESNIILYKCKKCKYVERQADGTGNG